MKKSFMRTDTKYTLLLVLEGILLSFFLMWILYIELLPPTDKVFAEVFDVNVRVDFEMTYKGEGFDWDCLYEGSISSETILPLISDWETEVPEEYLADRIKPFFDTITNGLFKVSARDPFFRFGNYYLAAYDIDKEKVLLYESN